jgi:hypothetical protein
MEVAVHRLLNQRVVQPRILLLGLLLGCTEPPLDTTRQVPERGTLGEEIFRLFHRDFERENPRRAEGFALAKDELVLSIDHLFPPDELAHTQEFLVKLLPLYDDETLPGVTERLSGVFERLSLDPEARESIAAIMHRTGYVDLAHEEALVRRIATYPAYPDLMKATLELLLAHDGLDPAGAPDPDEDDVLRRVQSILSRKLVNAELSDDDQQTIVLLTDLLLSEDPRLAGGNGEMPHVAVRDVRGMARVRMPGGNVPAPFVDMDGDGLADINDAAQFVDVTGQPIELPPFGSSGSIDGLGRPVGGDGQPLYEYVELDRTLLAGLLRETKLLIDRGIPMKAVRTIDTVLGERTGEGRYSAEDSPILDLVHAVEQTANMRELPDLLELLRILLEQHEGTLSWLLLEVEAQNEVADHHAVGLERGSSFFNDLLGWIRKVLREPGLAEEILEAIQDPVFDNLSPSTSLLLGYKKDLITEADVANGTVFTTLVDRTQPDMRGNQSIQQRMLHLMYDTRGARYVPELIGIPIGFIFQIDDLAEFYILSIIGEAEIPSLVSSLTGLSERPTPEELAVFLNQDQTFGNPVGHEGVDVKDNDGDTLYAIPASGFVDVLRPLVRIFHDRGQLPLLMDLFEILHLHWASKEGNDFQNQNADDPRYSKLSGIARYEPLLIETFQTTHVLDAVRRLLIETEALRLDSGRDTSQMLLAVARKLLTKDGDLENRQGERQVIIDGERITPLSPFDLIRASMNDLDRVVGRSAETQAEWDEVTTALTDVLLDFVRTGPESGQIENRRAIPVLLLLLSFFEDRARLHHTSDAALSAWITGEAFAGFEETITGEGLPATIDLLFTLDENEQLDAAFTGLRDQLFDEQEGFGDLLATLGDGLQAAKDGRIAIGTIHFLGRELDPGNDLLFQAGTLTQRSLALDEEEFMLEVLRRSIDARPAGSLFVYGLTAAIRQANRNNPLEYGTPSADDLRAISTVVSRYLVDDQHGMEKFYELVKYRKLENRGAE